MARMEITDQNHSSDISSEQEVNRYTEKLAQTFGLNEQNAEVYNTLPSITDFGRIKGKNMTDTKKDYLFSPPAVRLKEEQGGSENRTLKKQLDDYHSEYISLKRTVKRLERDVKCLEREIEDLDECVDKDTVVDLIHEIVPSLINEKGRSSSYSSETSEESDSVETYVVRERKAVPHAFAPSAKQRRRERPRKVKRMVV
jgi:hypothetical protein